MNRLRGHNLADTQQTPSTVMDRAIGIVAVWSAMICFASVAVAFVAGAVWIVRKAVGV